MIRGPERFRPCPLNDRTLRAYGFEAVRKQRTEALSSMLGL